MRTYELLSRTGSVMMLSVFVLGGSACAQQQDAQDPWGQTNTATAQTQSVASVYVPVSGSAPASTAAPVYQITPQQREQLKVTMAQTAQQVGQAAKDFKEFYAEMQKAFADSGLAEEIEKLNLGSSSVSSASSAGSAGFGAADVKVAETSITVTVDLPGVEKKNVAVSIAESSQLKVRVDRPAEENRADYKLRERYKGKFEKTIELPYKAKGTSFKAELKNGVLTVIIPKDKTAAPNEVVIPIG